MQVLNPEILATTRQLSVSVLLAIWAIGVSLWLYGGRTHRFWLALAVTVAAGIVGLQVSRDFGVQPLVAALLLALSAGSLALALARIGVFVAGGITGLFIARSLANGWNDFMCFLAGGLLGITLFPVWIAVLSSTVGTVLMAYGGVGVLDSLLRMDSPRWAERNAPLINWGVSGWIILGMFLQYALEKRHKKGKESRKEEKKEEKPAPLPLPPAPSPEKTPWWDLQGLFGKPRKAA